MRPSTDFAVGLACVAAARGEDSGTGAEAALGNLGSVVVQAPRERARRCEEADGGWLVPHSLFGGGGGNHFPIQIVTIEMQPLWAVETGWVDSSIYINVSVIYW